MASITTLPSGILIASFEVLSATAAATLQSRDPLGYDIYLLDLKTYFYYSKEVEEIKVIPKGDPEQVFEDLSIEDPSLIHVQEGVSGITSGVLTTQLAATPTLAESWHNSGQFVEVMNTPVPSHIIHTCFESSEFTTVSYKNFKAFLRDNIIKSEKRITKEAGECYKLFGRMSLQKFIFKDDFKNREEVITQRDTDFKTKYKR